MQPRAQRNLPESSHGRVFSEKLRSVYVVKSVRSLLTDLSFNRLNVWTPPFHHFDFTTYLNSVFDIDSANIVTLQISEFDIGLIYAFSPEYLFSFIDRKDWMSLNRQASIVSCKNHVYPPMVAERILLSLVWQACTKSTYNERTSCQFKLVKSSCFKKLKYWKFFKNVENNLLEYSIKYT